MVYIRFLLWDNFNTRHIEKHDVTAQEVEEVCRGNYIVRQSYLGRTTLTAPTSSGRILTVVVAPNQEDKAKGIFYPITARPASRKERRWYQEEIQGGENE